MQASIWTYIFLTAIFVGFIMQFYLIVRQRRYVRAHRNQVPALFHDKVGLQEHQKAADYTCAKTYYQQWGQIWDTAIILLWTLGGGIGLLMTIWQTAALPSIWMEAGFIISFLLIGSILDIPFEYIKTFRLEQKFDFNRMGKSRFFKDVALKTVLLLLIACPFTFIALQFISHNPQYWYWYVWVLWLIFSLAMFWGYPRFIAPLFNKFTPLEKGELYDRIDQLLVQNGFANQGILVMDGSERSSHGNAYFTGMGNQKRIVFFDTLINQLNTEEIEAVLAHELGHFKCNHIIKRFITIAAISLGALFLLALLIRQDWFYTGLGIEYASNGVALVLFMILISVFSQFIQPIFAFVSRKHEFEADDFASQKTDPKHLISALVKLYSKNASTLTPDPLYSTFHDSHPPAPVRIAHLLATKT